MGTPWERVAPRPVREAERASCGTCDLATPQAVPLQALGLLYLSTQVWQLCSRLRRGLLCIPLTCENVLVDVLPGRVSGAVGLIAANVLVGRTWCLADGGAMSAVPTRFPTMVTSIRRWPPASAVCVNTIRVAVGERCRTAVN